MPGAFDLAAQQQSRGLRKAIALPFAQLFHGLNRAVSPQDLDGSESPDTTDTCSYQDKIGALGPRPGRARSFAGYFGSTAVPLLGLGVANVGSGRLMVNAQTDGTWNAEMFSLYPSGFSYSAALPGLTGMDLSAKVHFVQYGNLLFVFNGRNRMRVMDTKGWSLAGIDGGIDGPTFVPSTSLSGGGVVRVSTAAIPFTKPLIRINSSVAIQSPTTYGYVYYVVAANYNQVDAFGRAKEALPSSPSVPITVTDQVITIGNIPATHIDPQVTHWNIYRNKSGEYDTGLLPENQDFYLVDKVAIGTTTYADSTPDDLLTGHDLVRFFQNVPPTCTMAEVYGDRIFACGFNPIQDGTVTVNADTTKIDFSGVGYNLPDGVKGCWFQVQGQVAKYRIKSLISSTQIQLADAFVGALSAGAYTIYRNPWEIYFSQQGNVQAWGEDGEFERNRLDLPGHETPTAMKAFGGALLIFTAKNIYAITGKGPARTAVKLLPDPIYSGFGCVGQDAICVMDNECSFLSPRGPATITTGAPRLFGIVLNDDWLTSLTTREAALAVMGTDDFSVWVSVPVSGQTICSKTFRYERQTQSWWEETEMCPTIFVRENLDSTDPYRPKLYYLQDRFVIQPKSGTLDLVAAALTGTLAAPVVKNVTLAVLTSNVVTLTATAHGFIVGQAISVALSAPADVAFNGAFVITAKTTDTLSYAKVHADIGSSAVAGTVTGVGYDNTSILVAAGGLPTLVGGLEQCYVRVYGTRNGIPNQYIGNARITSNTATKMVWTSNPLLPGKVDLIMQPGDTWEIGNVGWKWLTKTEGNPAHLNNLQDVWVTFAVRNMAELYKWDVIDGTESLRRHKTRAAVQIEKWDTNKASFEYAARIGSRSGAVIKNIQLSTVLEAENM